MSGLNMCCVSFLQNITFLQNYYILQLLTIGNDYPVPVDKHNRD